MKTKITIALYILLATKAASFATYTASLKSNLINTRTGPGNIYPIEYIYKRKGLPVIVTAEFNNWKKIKDQDGDEGWVAGNLISKKPTVIITKNDTILYKSTSKGYIALARIEKGVIADVLKVEPKYIQVKIKNLKGWILKKNTWGLNPN